MHLNGLEKDDLLRMDYQAYGLWKIGTLRCKTWMLAFRETWGSSGPLRMYLNTRESRMEERAYGLVYAVLEALRCGQSRLMATLAILVTTTVEGLHS